jgi:hypothetical protein
VPVTSEIRQKVAALRYQERELYLSPGRYVIGRAPTSDIVLRTRLASRQHACLTIGNDACTIEDLGSANGVGVNGKRIAGPCTLSPGDRITIAHEELEFRDFGYAHDMSRSTVEEETVHVPVKEEPVLESGTYGNDSTVQHDGFELAGSMAQRALASHRLQDAVDILRYRLARVLDTVKRGQPVPLRVRDAAVDYACKLAIATHDKRWAEYVLELLIAQSAPCPEAHTSAMRQAIEAVGDLDAELLERYARSLRMLPSSLDHVRAIQYADTLLRSFQSRR